MLCAVCKGKGLCGLERCQIIARFSARATTIPLTGYSGSAPSIFIRSSCYPAVRGGPLLIGDQQTLADFSSIRLRENDPRPGAGTAP